MQTLNLPRRKLDPKAFVKRTANETDGFITVRQPTRITTNGKLVLVYDEPFRGKPQPAYFPALRKYLEKLKYENNTRTGGLVTNSRIFGFSPRNARRRKHFCSPTRLNSESSEFYNGCLKPLALAAMDSYRAADPATLNRHQQLANTLDTNYRIGKSLFTSGIINHNNVLKYHFDTGNFEDVLSVMWVFKTKGSTGGNLVLPEYNSKIAVADASVTLFDGQKAIHGVTPITGNGHRFSLVFYSLKSMWKCKPISEELAEAKGKEIEQAQRRPKAKKP